MPVSIPAGTKFEAIKPTTNVNRRSALVNANDLTYTIEDIAAVAGGAKVAQVEITEAEILNASGFSKLLVPSVTNKILIPISLALYRKPGGTNYIISNSIRLITILGISSSTLGNTADAAFTGSTQGSLILTYAAGLNSNLSPNNNLSLVSGSAFSPSTISGGTGNLIAYITYIEIDTN
jgi:hypothetical protein